MTTFGERVRELRNAKNLSQRELAAEIEVNFTYISKIENGKLEFSDFPSEKLIRRMAVALYGDVDELPLLAKKVPETIRRRILERPEAFRKLADLDDKEIDRLLENIE